MKHIKILILVLSPIFTFSQSNFKVLVNVISPSCNQNNGIIKIETNAISPIFTWDDGVSFSDSIAYNLGPGNYTVHIKDINNYVQTKIINLTDTQKDCSIPPLPIFEIVKLNNGIIRINTPYSSNYDLKCEIEGNIYNNIYSNILHQFQLPGMYNVCITLSNKKGNVSSCNQVDIPNWDVEIVGKSIMSSSLTTIPSIGSFKTVECGSKKFFINNGNSNVEKIYTFDESTKQLILLPIDNLSRNGDNVYSTACYNNKLYFGGKVGDSGHELCESDGTIGGTKVAVNYINIPNRGIQPGNLITLNGNLYFDGKEQNESGSSEYTFKFDGNNIQKIGGLGLHGIYNCRIFKNQILHNYSSTNYRLGMFDGNNITNLLSENTYSHLYDELNGNMIFANSDGNITELWSTDGSVNGTYKLKNIKPLFQNLSSIKNGNKVYFIADNGVNGYELWVTDGTENGTIILKDITLGIESSTIDNLIIFNNKVYFIANNYLWETDGTEVGTKQVLFNNTSILVGNSFQTSKLFIYENLLFVPLITRGYIYLNLEDKFTTFQTECTDRSFYGSSIKFNNGNNYLIGIENSNYVIFKPCDFNFPKTASKLSFWGEENTFTTPLNTTSKWYDNSTPGTCNPRSTQPTFSIYSYDNEVLRLKVKNLVGCESFTDTIKIYTHNRTQVSLENIQRCNINQFKAEIKISGILRSNNTFILFVGLNNSIPFQIIPFQIIDNKLIADIPLELQNVPYFNAILVGNSPNNQISSESIIPSYINSNASYILGDKTIRPGNNTNITVLFSGLPPYNFKINESSFNNILQNPYHINVSPTANTNYVLSNFENNCGTGIIKKNMVNINISQCYQNIIQSGIIEGNFNAFGKIESTGKILPNNVLLYGSESNIELNPGFHVENGAIFKAEIKTCN